MRSKKSQITVFIILGIILLFSSALVLYIKKQVEVTPSEIKIAVEQVPLEIKPIQDFVTSCVEQVGENGVRKLGSQGGYIDVSKFKVNLADPTEGDAVSFGGMVVPYWYYMNTPNKCPEGCGMSMDNMPVARGNSPNSFETQISNYVDANLKDCLEGFAKFKQEGFEITEVSDVKTTTTIGDNNVYVGVSYTLDVTKNTVKQQMTQYAASLPVNLNKIYSLANEIIEMEQNYTYFERVTLEMISAYSGLSYNRLPPFGEGEYGFSPTISSWPVSVAAERFKEALATNSQRFQIMDTANYRRYTYPDVYRQFFSDEFVMGPMKKSYSNLDVNFAFLNWPVYFKINNAENFKPSGVQLPLIMFNIYRYRAIYDVSYPLEITISDKSAFNQKGYDFNFAIESNVRANKGLRYADISYGMTSPLPSGSPLLCDENQKLSGNITVTATDILTSSKVDGVSVIFNCGDTSCAMGTTGANGKLVSKFPICIGGSMSFAKYGYFAKSIPFSTELDRSRSVQAELYKKVKLNVTVMKKRMSLTINTTFDPITHMPKKVNRRFQFDPNAVPIQEDEQAMLTFSRIPGYGEEDLTQFIVYSNETKFAEIELVPGDYSVTGSLILNQRVVIPKDPCYKSYRDKWWNPFDEKCIEIDEISMDKLPRGGLAFDKPELYLKIVKQDLIGKSNMDVYVISTIDGFNIDENGTASPALKHDDLNQMGKTEEYSMKYRRQLEPDFR